MTLTTENPGMQQREFFAPRRLGHVNLWVDDLQRSEDFYHQICGLMVEFTEPDLEATFLGVGHTAHDLGMMRTTGGKDRYGRDGALQLPGTIGLSVGLNHLAWELKNEAELIAAFKNMRRSGITHDTLMDHQIAHSVYMFDPDGNYNEFYCDTVEDWRSVLSGEMGLITSRWDPDQAEGFEDSRFPSNPVLKTNTSSPLQPARLTHVVLETCRLQEMLEFYRDVAGLEVLGRQKSAVYLRGSADGYRFGLVLVEAASSRYGYASFELMDDADFEKALEGLAARKIEIEKLVDQPWKRSLFLRDPDGLMSEWYVDRQAPRDLSDVDDRALVFSL